MESWFQEFVKLYRTLITFWTTCITSIKTTTFLQMPTVQYFHSIYCFQPNLIQLLFWICYLLSLLLHYSKYGSQKLIECFLTIARSRMQEQMDYCWRVTIEIIASFKHLLNFKNTVWCGSIHVIDLLVCENKKFLWAYMPKLWAI